MAPSKLREGFDRSRPDLPVGTSFATDASFQALLERCERLGALRNHVRTDLRSEAFSDQLALETRAVSSYNDHGYSDLFYGLARVLRPEICVELGVLHGLSLLTVAAALRANSRGAIQGYDLFERYPYRHETFANMARRVTDFGLGDYASVQQGDARYAHRSFETVDYLHVDLSNDGDTYRWVFDEWEHKVRRVIVLEGGSPDRDAVPWMRQYGKAPIVPTIAAIRQQYPHWLISVLEPFPSVTVAVRLGECEAIP